MIFYTEAWLFKKNFQSKILEKSLVKIACQASFGVRPFLSRAWLDASGRFHLAKKVRRTAPFSSLHTLCSVRMQPSQGQSNIRPTA